MTELLKNAQLPQCDKTAVLVAQHQIYQNYLHKNRTFRIFKSCKEEKNSRQKCSTKFIYRT